MSDLIRSPTKVEQLLGLLLSLAAMVAFGIGASLLWTAGGANVAAALFTALSVASAVFLFRAARTAPRALGASESKILAGSLVFLGTCGTVAAAISFGAGSKRLLLLGAAISCLISGLAVARRGR
jgi:hypothetical protein